MRTKITLSMIAVLSLHVEAMANEQRDRISSVKEAESAIMKTEQKTQKSADSIKEMFSEGQVSGQIRSSYLGWQTSVANSEDSYSSAIGGQLKYETAAFNGFSLASAFYTSQNISSGDGEKYNPELLGGKKGYTILAEAYANIAYESFNFRGGRQLIDTPLADSDDIRMTPHTFEAYVASYELENFTFLGANVQRWQGVDTDVFATDGNEWEQTGADNKGTWMGAITYSSDIGEAGAWYYNVGDTSNAIYLDATKTFGLSKDIELAVGLQYLNERELKNSNIAGQMYGIWSEVVIYGLGINIGYNQASTASGESLFGGFGGGPFFTNMDIMTAENLSDGYKDPYSLVVGASYGIDKLNLLAAYGDYKAYRDNLGAGTKAHVSEFDIGAEYSFTEEFMAAIIYVKGDDKESSVKTAYDDSHLRVVLNYNF
jgi:hypothetical protein